MKKRYKPTFFDYDHILLGIGLLAIACTIWILNLNTHDDDTDTTINYTYDYGYEDQYMWNLLDFADVLLQNVTVNSVEDAINYARQYDGVCRHYSTILYILLHNHLNRSVFLVSGMGLSLNCSDYFIWTDDIDTTGNIYPMYVSNHMWVYDPEYGEIDLMKEKNLNCSSEDIPIFAIARYDKWGYKTYANFNNTKLLYDFYLSIFERNGLSEMNKTELRFQTTKQWLSDKGY